MARITFGLATSRWRALPDFLVIGAQRGGTSAIYSDLARHPQVLPAIIKEVHFFDRNYHRGWAWYRGFFPLRARTGRGVPPLTGEATPDYIFDPHAAQGVAERLPEVKLIASLRNPVDRAFSGWKLMTAQGHEHLGFEEAIEAEPQRMEAAREQMLQQPKTWPPDWFRFGYLARGRYAEQLEPWLALFPRSQLLVLPSEDYYADAPKTYARITDFLGLERYRLATQSRVNASRAEAMASSTRARLVDEFRDDNRRLSNLLGIEFDWEG